MSLSEHYITMCSETDLKRFTRLRDGKIAINSIEVFEHFRPTTKQNYLFLDIIEAFADVAKHSSNTNFGQEPHTGSLNNCKGRWFELLFFSEFNTLLLYYNSQKKSTRDKLSNEFLRLPSATGDHKFQDLFIKSEKDELRRINPSTSNPDFIILKNLTRPVCPQGMTIIDRFRFVDYFGKVRMKNLDTVISIKTSARPDRRYQQVYEANLIKALFKRFGLVVRFLSVTLHENKRNEEVYYSPSIISIVEDNEGFKPTINNSFVLKKISDVQIVFEYIFPELGETPEPCFSNGEVGTSQTHFRYSKREPYHI